MSERDREEMYRAEQEAERASMIAADAEAHAEAAESECAELRGHVGELESALAAALAERDEARATIARLNRRAQEAESAIKERLAKPTDPRGFGRILANGAAAMYKRERDEAVSAAEALRERVTKLADMWSNGTRECPDGDRCQNTFHVAARALRRALASPPPLESPNPEKETP
jgi:hypothetical protein